MRMRFSTASAIGLTTAATFSLVGCGSNLAPRNAVRSARDDVISAEVIESGPWRAVIKRTPFRQPPAPASAEQWLAVMYDGTERLKIQYGTGPDRVGDSGQFIKAGNEMYSDVGSVAMYTVVSADLPEWASIPLMSNEASYARIASGKPTDYSKEDFDAALEDGKLERIGARAICGVDTFGVRIPARVGGDAEAYIDAWFTQIGLLRLESELVMDGGSHRLETCVSLEHGVSAAITSSDFDIPETWETPVIFSVAMNAVDLDERDWAGIPESIVTTIGLYSHEVAQVGLRSSGPGFLLFRELVGDVSVQYAEAWPPGWLWTQHLENESQAQFVMSITGENANVPVPPRVLVRILPEFGGTQVEGTNLDGVQGGSSSELYESHRRAFWYDHGANVRVILKSSEDGALDLESVVRSLAPK